MEHVNIYTDGSCLGNPGAGGWAVVVCGKEKYKVKSGSKEWATNNGMELQAMMEAFKLIIKLVGTGKKYKFTVHSDSSYVVNTITKGWFTKWMMNGWKTQLGKKVKNLEQWREFFKLWLKVYDELKVSVKIEWVQGHVGNEFNEMADKHAKEASLKAQGLTRSKEAGEGQEGG